VSLAVCGTNLFAGTYVGGVFRSSNNGISWKEVNAGLGDAIVYALAGSDTNLFAGTTTGVFRSTNSGASWTAANAGLANIRVNALAFSGTSLFAGTSVGVFLSTDSGASWTTVNTGLTNPYVSALAVSGKDLFAGTRGRGVFLSTNSGASWTAVNAGWTDTYVLALAGSGTSLFAGTEGSGVWRRALSDLVSVKHTSIEIPTKFALVQNYPNPFNPSTIIRFELPKSSVVKLSVCDLLGREVSVLVNERRNTGVYEVKFDGSNLASGVYFCRLQAGDFVATKRLLLTK
jgi:ligand-binding sensor domain-containing protein